MRSVILSQWGERRMGVIWQDRALGLTTVQASAMDLLETGSLRLREFIVKRITVIKFGVNDRCSNGISSWRIEERPDTAKLTNVIAIGFGEICYLVRENKMFIKDKAEISSRMWGGLDVFNAINPVACSVTASHDIMSWEAVKLQATGLLWC